MYFTSTKRTKNLFKAAPHLGIGGGRRELLWNVSMDSLFDTMDPENKSWQAERLRECDMMLIQVNVFGTNKLYKLVDPKKILAYKQEMDTIAGMDTRRDNYMSNRRYYVPDMVDSSNPNKVITFFWSLMDIDTAPAKTINLMSRLIPFNKFITVEKVLEISTQHHIINGLNQFYESNGIPTRASMGFSSYEYEDSPDPVIDEYGDQVEGVDKANYLFDNVEASKILESEIPFDSIIPNFAPDNYEPGKFKFIIDLPYERIKFTNSIVSSNFTRLFIYIPGFDLWQEVSKRDLEGLMRVSSGKITYSRVDDPHCFSNVFYTSEFTMDNVDSILFNSIAIPSDIHWHAMFDWQCTDTIERKKYDPPMDYKSISSGKIPVYEALTFDFECYKYNIHLTLTQQELGIGNNSYQKEEVTGISAFDENRYTPSSDFWMLGLINQIIALKPSMGDTFIDGDGDD